MAELKTASQIRSSPQPLCYLCGQNGRLLHEGLRDELFGAAGTWNVKMCPNRTCGLMWLDPRPLEDDIANAYSRYYTHGEISGSRHRHAIIRSMMNLQRKLSTLSILSPIHVDRERILLMYLNESPPGKLLDVGCGDGSRLTRMKALGWDVQGQDLDPSAVAQAREKLGSRVHLGQLRDIGFANEKFDYITLNHVIEHVHDPVDLLSECRRILKRGGVLVAVTPNAKSFGHQYFDSHWRGLEPPRHIHLFSPSAMEAAASRAGFERIRVWTSIANAASFAYGSYVVRSGGRLDQGLVGTCIRRICINAYKVNILLRYLLVRDVGEECVIWATR